jgi:hypothetical protein
MLRRIMALTVTLGAAIDRHDTRMEAHEARMDRYDDMIDRYDATIAELRE